MSFARIKTLVFKDISLYGRNLFLVLISLLSLIIYGVVYWVLPSDVGQKFSLATYPATLPPNIREVFTSREIELVGFDSEAAMLEAVEGGSYRAGLVLTSTILEPLQAGQPVTIQAYYPPGVPAELNTAFTDFLTLIFNDAVYRADEFQINRHEETLGYDLAQPLAPRDRLLPLFVLLIFMTETMGLATLITEEVQRGTIKALLVTPLTIGQLFTAKTVTGLLLACGQALILLAITNSLGINPGLLLIILVLGALFVTGVGFVIAAFARDMLSVLGWSTFVLLLLGIPSVSILFPGTVGNIVKLIPSHYLIDSLHQVINFGAGWSAVLFNLSVLLLISSGLLLVGMHTLRKKVAV